MRNNEDRTGSRKAHAASSPTPAPLEFVRPTTIVDLPSEGRFYLEGHPLCNQETIEIRQMTTAEEDILANRTLLRNGTAIDKFLTRLLVDANVGPEDLTIGDKNAVLIQARIDGYGAEYATRVTCPSCQQTNKHVFDLHECTKVTGDSLPEGVVQSESGGFLVSLDNNWVVEIRALTGADETRLMKRSKKKGSEDSTAISIQDQLTAMIVSVSGHSDRTTVRKAVEHMTGKQSRKVRDAYKNAIPNIQLKSDYACRACGSSTELEVPLNADFFWGND